MSDAAPLATGSRDELVATHRPLLESALAALRERGYWSAFSESPSTKVWGEEAPALGRAAFESLLGKDFPLVVPGAVGAVAPERPPYGVSFDVRYPHVIAAGVPELLEAASAGMSAWRDAGPLVRAAVCVEILQRVNARSFEFAHAVMHTTGQGFVMAFQAGGAHALDRALEAVAASYGAMTAVPESAPWVKPRGRGEPQRIVNRFVPVPRGVALVIGCTTFPTWNGYPGLFASLVTGNPVVVKPHPHAVLPFALAVSAAQSVLSEFGFDPNLVTLAVEESGEGLASVLAVHPSVKLIDYTGSSSYGEWLEAHATQAIVFAEKSGVNAVVVDSTDDLPGLAANLAYSLSLYSGQMCTTPQVIFVPAAGFRVGSSTCSVDDFVAALSGALDDLLGDATRASAILGAIVNDNVLERSAAAASLGTVAITSDSLQSKDFPDARIRTPLVVRLDASQVDAYGSECFGPVAFVVTTSDTDESLEIWRSLVASKGALTASVYSTADGVVAAAEAVALDAGVSVSFNLTGDVYVNQTSAFADFHGTGANPAANASLTDAAFVTNRFRFVQLRRPA
ncbi:MAG: phenylacetic acid degradation protein PaaN [Acidothermaceae bacterium]